MQQRLLVDIKHALLIKLRGYLIDSFIISINYLYYYFRVHFVPTLLYLKLAHTKYSFKGVRYANLKTT